MHIVWLIIAVVVLLLEIIAYVTCGIRFTIKEGKIKMHTRSEQPRKVAINCTPKWMILKKQIVFIDTPNHSIQPILKKKHVRIRTIEELLRDDNRYIITLCTVWIWNLIDFTDALDELGRNMLLTGHDDYDEVVDGFIKAVDEANASYDNDKSSFMKALEKFTLNRKEDTKGGKSNNDNKATTNS